MVKIATLAIAIASVLPTLTTAAACTDGLIYCGYNLLKKGHYTEEMAAELQRTGHAITQDTLHNTLYVCGAGGHGWIELIQFCNRGCGDGGSGNDDYCN